MGLSNQTIKDEIIRDMANKLLEPKEFSKADSRFYWYGEIPNKDGYVAKGITKDTATQDFKKIEEALYLLKSYQQFGVNFDPIIKPILRNNYV